MPTFRLSYSPSPQPPVPSPRTGITLVEILISMFVLLFGLMGVAAIFPVASHYVQDGDKKDRSSSLAQIAFTEIKARGLLDQRAWLYPTNSSPTLSATAYIDTAGTFAKLPPASSGNALVIDPLGSTDGSIPGNKRWFFPIPVTSNPPNPWGTSVKFPAVSAWPEDSPMNWPVRRMTLPRSSTFAIMANSAETMFRLRDDLAIEQPEAGDRPSVQRFATGTGGQLLSRQYQGDYSWLATVVPTSNQALKGLAPAENLRDEYYEVSAVVFYKRDAVPSVTTAGSPGSERLISAEFLGNGELAIYDSDTSVANPDTIETALDSIKPSSWIAVMGVNQVTGVLMMKWYKILALDDETTPNYSLPGAGTQDVRIAMVQGPDWPESRDASGNQRSYWDLRVVILPGVVDVYTRTMVLD